MAASSTYLADNNFMSRSTFIKFIIPLLFALAVTLGLVQHYSDPYVGSNTQTFHSKTADPNKSLLDYFKEANELKPESQTSTATFLAVGDIMLSRNVAGTIKKTNDPLLPFRKMENIFSSVDFSFGNLESPLSGRNDFNPSGSLVFNAPPAYTQGLKDYNFKIINLANNHALDQGTKGVDYTLKFLNNAGIQHVGMGMNLDEAWLPKTIEQNGIKICFVGASYSSVNDSGKITNNYVARIEDLDRLKSSILNLKSSCDFIVATMHAGTEYTHKPNQAQIGFAHAAIDYGADVVIGAHPHWVQTIEKYNDKYIFYSLGNFIFDQEWSQETKEGLTLKIQVSKNQETKLQGPKVPAKIDSIELIPVIIENYSTPRPATDIETKKILEKIGETNTLLK